MLGFVASLHLFKFFFELKGKLILDFMQNLQHILANVGNDLVLLKFFLQKPQTLLDLLVVKII